MSGEFQAFSAKLESLPTPEERIACGIDFLRSAISQEGSPRFREFWEARRLILPAFKENINPAIRSKLWGDFVELTVEARRLKEILEEQSAFAIEQIDLAIQAIAQDIENFQALLDQTSPLDFSDGGKTLAQKRETYSTLQSELHLLNTLASRLSGLRREVIKTDMRVRQKTKFFKRLSELGDRVFPKRKELIDQVSAEFEKDVDQFLSDHFKEGNAVGAPYFALRDEIKALQGMAKRLTLSSGAFSRTRTKLSGAWDQMKVLEKEHKKEALEKKMASSASRSAIQAKITDLTSRAPNLALPALDAEIEAIFQEMRRTDLHREDVRFLKDELHALRAPHLAVLEQKAKELEAAEKEKLRVKREKLDRIREAISSLSQEAPQLDAETLETRLSAIEQEAEGMSLSKFEKQPLERALRPLHNALADKKEAALLNLSDDQKEALSQLKTVLEQRKERRQAIKNQLEIYRKALGSSGLDFEKAMMYQELVEQEKELLEKANLGIEEIEEKIAELEG
jgi:hypothetical protein